MATEKRAFKEIRKQILLSLSKGQLSINEIAKQSKINWKTVSNHLIYLTGMGFVKEVFSSSYVRIYELTDSGKSFILNNISKKIKIQENKKFPRINQNGI